MRDMSCMKEKGKMAQSIKLIKGPSGLWGIVGIYNCRKCSELESYEVVVREQDVCGRNSQREM